MKIDLNRIVAPALSLLLCGVLLACQESDRSGSEDAHGAAITEKVVDRELDATLEKLNDSRATLTTLERAKLDEWRQRLSLTEKKMSEGVADAPEQRRKWNEELASMRQEIKSEAEDLLAKVKVRR